MAKEKKEIIIDREPGQPDKVQVVTGKRGKQSMKFAQPDKRKKKSLFLKKVKGLR